MLIAPRRTVTPLVVDRPQPCGHAPSTIPAPSSRTHAIPSGPSARNRRLSDVGSNHLTDHRAGPTDEHNIARFHQEPTTGLSRRESSGRLLFNNSHPPRRSASCAAATQTPMPAVKVQRWDGLNREASEWDGLRRDPELWFDDGDCLVHLYARGQSRRGPAFCVPFSVLKESSCGSMFSLCFAQMTVPTGNTCNSNQLANGSNMSVSSSNKVELFIPASDDTSREAAFKWHIATRNFFAYIFGRPLVGEHLGQALVDLQERMHLFRSGQVNNSLDLLKYTETQGYRNLVNCPDYALAVLFYAEHYKLRDLWIDAFAHCVGMNESLALSPEFAPLSRLTKALITRAYLEMDIHLGRVTAAVRNFLDDDLSPAYLGLPDGARAHLDRFRSFLHGFYVEKFGYWPPPRGSVFSKALLKSMYFDFRNLHDYLVDHESTTDIASQKPASGGICVLQNVASFDQRHNFTPLPHPLPLLPLEVPLRRRTESQKALKTLALGSKIGKTDCYLTARASLMSATNGIDASVMDSAMMQAYLRFERLCALNQRAEKISMADARKVRWLVIYETLQYLASALRAPKEVRDTEGPEYPLCCLVTEQSPWQAGTKVLTSPLTQSINVPEAIDDFLTYPNGISPGQASPITSAIQPDCQTEDYFSHTNVDTTSAPVSVEVPAPLKISLSRRNSTRQSISRLSLSKRSSRRNSVRRHPPAHCEILVQGYGNGLNDMNVNPPFARCSVYSSSSVYSSQVPSRQPSTVINDAHMHPSQRLALAPQYTDEVLCASSSETVSPVISFSPWASSSSSDSTASVDSRNSSDARSSVSSESSFYAISENKTSSAEDSGLLGGFVPFGATSLQDAKTSPLSAPTTPNNEFRFSFQTEWTPDTEPLQHSPANYHADPAIGIALSAPLPPPKGVPCAIPMAALSSESSPPKASRSPDPMRDNEIDIFSALDISSIQEKPNIGKAAPASLNTVSLAKMSKKGTKPKSVSKTMDEDKAKLAGRRRSLFSIRL